MAMNRRIDEAIETIIAAPVEIGDDPHDTLRTEAYTASVLRSRVTRSRAGQFSR